MGEPALRRFTVEEFLAWEAEQEDDNTYELNDGQIVVKDGEPLLLGGKLMVMSAPSDAHQEIASNIAFALRRRLEPPRRSVQQPKVPVPDRADAHYRPDVIVTCVAGPAGHATPTVVVEVLSRSTKDYDRGTKLEDYQAIPSVAELLLTASDRRRVRLWQRDGVRWIVQDFIAASAVPLASVGAELPLDEVYAGVEV
jgi:Uma2 family endonuclease